MFSTPVSNIISLSKPRPNPVDGAYPCFLKFTYQSSSVTSSPLDLIVWESFSNDSYLWEPPISSPILGTNISNPLQVPSSFWYM